MYLLTSVSVAAISMSIVKMTLSQKSKSANSSKNRSAEIQKISCRPFIKWVGGKTQLLPQLLERCPDRFKRYHEPFIGGGAFYFALQPKRGWISDINAELINVYEVVRDNPKALIQELKKHRYEKDYFYAVRNIDRTEKYKTLSPVARGARLIFLNRCCFNGLYRVNSQGQFNTPFGRYRDPKIVDVPNLMACSVALAETTIKNESFLSVESRAKSGDFVYFDPPYVPLSSTANFTSYSDGGFDEQMQVELVELCKRLDKKGVQFMLSNSSAPFVLKNTNGAGEPQRLHAKRFLFLERRYSPNCIAICRILESVSMK